MNKMYKALLTSLVLVLATVIIPACTHKKQIVKQETTTTTQTPAPDLSATVDTGTPVASNTDFVQPEAEVKTETIPSDIDDVNRWAAKNGYIKDAFFSYDESTLDGDAQSALSTSATWLKGKDGASYNLLIQGHCDERGTEQYNLALGDRRANIAKDYLVTLGVDAGRIRTVSYGEERPFEEGHDEASWAQNRRAHLVLVR